MIPVRRANLTLRPDCERVLLRRFDPGGSVRIKNILARVRQLSQDAAEQEMQRVYKKFGHRHRAIKEIFKAQCETALAAAGVTEAFPETQQQLVGAYFCMEYALEAAALFNASLVWHPDQGGVAPGARRFILSLRATGEGHISSITFRTGIVLRDHSIRLDVPSRYCFAAAPAHSARRKPSRGGESGGYDLQFPADLPLSGRVIFPQAACEKNGIEDARFVAFTGEDGRTRYYATYTAYDGKNIAPRLLETDDFLSFKSRILHGPAVANKGMALFPRKINGKYVMLSRQDGENINIMSSEDLYTWREAEKILAPAFPWEFVQLGNCGSPIETEAGWLVLTHGVGPVRQYAIGACLLDLHDPTRVIGRLPQPLLQPEKDEREGYVPNVVYSCGGQIFGKDLILPYAISDYATRFAFVELQPLLQALKS